MIQLGRSFIKCPKKGWLQGSLYSPFAESFVYIYLNILTSNRLALFIYLCFAYIIVVTILNN